LDFVVAGNYGPDAPVLWSARWEDSVGWRQIRDVLTNAQSANAAAFARGKTEVDVKGLNFGC
jgi:hypothetical protein